MSVKVARQLFSKTDWMMGKCKGKKRQAVAKIGHSLPTPLVLAVPFSYICGGVHLLFILGR